jgi:hypothetical protein
MFRRKGKFAKKDVTAMDLDAEMDSYMNDSVISYLILGNSGTSTVFG